MNSEAPIMIELNPRERRLYDRLRARVVLPQDRPDSGFGDVVLLLPDLTMLLLRLMRDDRVPLGAKAVALAGLGYLFSPVDLLPGFLLGPVGLVDDLLVVTAACSRILNEVHPDVVRSHWSGKGDALDAVQRVTLWSQTKVWGRLRKALGRVF